MEIGEKLFPSDHREWTVERLTEQVLAVAPGVLTPKQLAVVRAVLDGKTDQEIAVELKISLATVRSHRSSAIPRLSKELNNGRGRVISGLGKAIRALAFGGGRECGQGPSPQIGGLVALLGRRSSDTTFAATDGDGRTSGTIHLLI